MKLCTKPFKGAIKPPRHEKWNPREQAKEPEIETDLEYVFGYRSKDMRNNIRYLPNGEILYNAAALGVVYNIKNNQQRFFREHRDDIVSMDVQLDGKYAATGEVGAKPYIYVWDTKTMEVKNKFRGLLKRGVDLLSFTPNGSRLVATGRDDDHVIALYDLTNNISKGGCLIVDQQGGRDIMLEIKMKNNDQFVTVGPKHFKLWTVKGEGKNKNLFPNKGRWGKNDCSDKLTTVAINQESMDAVAGAQDGTLQVFKEDKLIKFRKIHSKSIQSIAIQHNFIFTGGNDCKINVLKQSNYDTVLIIDSKTFEKSLCPKIRSINMHENKRQLIVGTYASDIFELTTKDNELRNNTVFIPKQVMAGHYTPNQQATNEVWGLAVFPNNKDFYATCSDDGTLRIWSASDKKMLKAVSINIDEKGNQLPPNEETKDISEKGKGRAIAISPDGNYIVVGHKDGSVRVLNKSLKIVRIFKEAQEEISDIKFSPDGTLMAVGSHDNQIYVYKLPNFKTKFRPLNKHSSYITHFDFSEDGETLHSTCGAYELLFWDMVKGKQQTSGATMQRDEKWSTWTVPIGYPVQGIYDKGYDGTDINAVDRSNFPVGNKKPNNYHLLATGDDYSKVNVFRYPCLQKGSKPITNRGHSSHVTNVKFTNDDKRILSTGGEDQCVMQWSVKKKPQQLPSIQRSNSQGAQRQRKNSAARSERSYYYKH